MLSGHIGTVPVSVVAVGDSLWSTNRPMINFYRKKNLVRLIVSLSLLLLYSELYFLYYATKLCEQLREVLLYLRRSYFFNTKTSVNTDGEKSL